MKNKALVLLNDGMIFHGRSIGIEGTATGEICFNTGMSGYQEIFTDPSYKGQIMVTANVHIGNYGISDEDSENLNVQISGLITRNFSQVQSRAKAKGKTLKDFLQDQRVVAITDVDTRALVKYIRDNGAQNAIVTTDTKRIDFLKKQLDDTPSMEGLELCSLVSTKNEYVIGDTSAKYKIVALDLGIKKSILKCLTDRDCFVKVFPFNTSYEVLKAEMPDAYFLSNGPGDPSASPEIIEVVKKICAILDNLIPENLNGISSYIELIAYVEDRPCHDVRYAIDANKIKTNLGWIPKENFESGILKTVQWYLANMSWSNNVQNGSYKLERLGVNLK